MNDKSLIKAEPRNIIQTMDDAERAAKAMAASGFFADAKQAAQAIVKILAGQELGFGAFASMTGVNIIQGKPVISANLMAAAVKRTGKYNYRIIEMTEQSCEIVFFETGKEVGRSRFTIIDATKAGLTGKDNWRKYARNMLFARALSNGQKWYCPDVFSGATVYTPDELDAKVDDEGNMIVTESKPQEQSKSNLINRAQAVRLFTITGKENESLLRETIADFGYESTKDILIKDYDSIVNEVELQLSQKANEAKNEIETETQEQAESQVEAMSDKYRALLKHEAENRALDLDEIAFNFGDYEKWFNVPESEAARFLGYVKAWKG